ncbi:hypothetical protein [Kangiella sp. M94]
MKKMLICTVLMFTFSCASAKQLETHILEVEDGLYFIIKNTSNMNLMVNKRMAVGDISMGDFEFVFTDVNGKKHYDRSKFRISPVIEPEHIVKLKPSEFVGKAISKEYIFKRLGLPDGKYSVVVRYVNRLSEGLGYSEDSVYISNSLNIEVK